MPASVLLENYEGVSDVCTSVPCVINSNGAKALPVHLDASEKQAFAKSAEVLKSMIREL